jgi:hypothetical protein
MQLPPQTGARRWGGGCRQVQSGCSEKSRCGEGRRVGREVACLWLVRCRAMVRRAPLVSRCRQCLFLVAITKVEWDN